MKVVTEEVEEKMWGLQRTSIVSDLIKTILPEVVQAHSSDLEIARA